MTSNAPDILVLGIGNAYRGDDAAGLHAVGRLMEQEWDGVILREQAGEGTALMDALDGPSAVVLIDAVESGAPPGTVHRWDVSAEGVNAKFLRCSTHNFSVHDAIEMARALDKLPPRVLLFGIEGGNFEPGAALSPEVEAALDTLTAEVRQAIHTLKEETRHA